MRPRPATSPWSSRPRQTAGTPASQVRGEKAQHAALAGALHIEGETQAAAIAAKGSAKAEAMQKKADAFDRYGDAAVSSPHASGEDTMSFLPRPP